MITLLNDKRQNSVTVHYSREQAPYLPIYTRICAHIFMI